jgi:predicted RNase H-like HicB family nuclease
VVYPVVFTPAGKGTFSVYVPDFDCNTQGADLADAIYMAEDVICLMGTLRQDDGDALPAPTDISAIKTHGGEIKSLVAVDLDAYRRKMERRVVKKTLSLPSWLNYEAEQAGINFSATLQDALKAKLGFGV